MQAEVALRSPSPAGRWPSAVVALRTGRKAARSGALWGYVFGAYVASAALGYAATYKTLAAREKFAAAFGKNAATDALIGPAHQIQTIAGFTAWRCLGVLSIVGAVWGLLIGTRLLRGEEEAGRWELLLAGQTTRRRAAGQALAGLGMGLAALFCLTAIITAVIGRSAKVHVSVGASIYFALALVASELSSSRLACSRASWLPRGARRPVMPARCSERATPCAWWPTRAPGSCGCNGLHRSDGSRSCSPSRHPTRCHCCRWQAP